MDFFNITESKIEEILKKATKRIILTNIELINKQWTNLNLKFEEIKDYKKEELNSLSVRFKQSENGKVNIKNLKSELPQ